MDQYGAVKQDVSFFRPTPLGFRQIVPHVQGVQTIHGYPMLVSRTVERCRKARAGWAWAECWTISRGYPTWTVERI